MVRSKELFLLENRWMWGRGSVFPPATDSKIIEIWLNLRFISSEVGLLVGQTPEVREVGLLAIGRGAEGGWISVVWKIVAPRTRIEIGQRRRCKLSSQGENFISKISLLPTYYLNRISVISLMTSKNISCDTSAIVSLPSMILSSLLSLINSFCHAYCEDMLVHVHGGALSYHYM